MLDITNQACSLFNPSEVLALAALVLSSSKTFCIISLFHATALTHWTFLGAMFLVVEQIFTFFFFFGGGGWSFVSCIIEKKISGSFIGVDR